VLCRSFVFNHGITAQTNCSAYKVVLIVSLPFILGYFAFFLYLYWSGVLIDSSRESVIGFELVWHLISWAACLGLCSMTVGSLRLKELFCWWHQKVQLLLFLWWLIICPIAIAYSMGQIIKSVCVCVSVCLWALSRSHFLIDFHQNWHRRKNPEK